MKGTDLNTHSKIYLQEVGRYKLRTKVFTKTRLMFSNLLSSKMKTTRTTLR